MNLKEIRTKRGFTQQSVADYIGCSSVVYSRYENGTRQPSIETLIKLADFFEVTIDYLLGYKGMELASLSKYESELVTASRNTDERAREDALQILLLHSNT